VDYELRYKTSHASEAVTLATLQAQYISGGLPLLPAYGGGSLNTSSSPPNPDDSDNKNDPQMDNTFSSSSPDGSGFSPMDLMQPGSPSGFLAALCTAVLPGPYGDTIGEVLAHHSFLHDKEAYQKLCEKHFEHELKVRTLG